MSGMAKSQKTIEPIEFYRKKYSFYPTSGMAKYQKLQKYRNITYQCEKKNLCQ